MRDRSQRSNAENQTPNRGKRESEEYNFSSPKRQKRTTSNQTLEAPNLLSPGQTTCKTPGGSTYHKRARLGAGSFGTVDRYTEQSGNSTAPERGNSTAPESGKSIALKRLRIPRLGNFELEDAAIREVKNGLAAGRRYLFFKTGPRENEEFCVLMPHVKGVTLFDHLRILSKNLD